MTSIPIICTTLIIVCCIVLEGLIKACTYLEIFPVYPENLSYTVEVLHEVAFWALAAMPTDSVVAN